MDGPTYPGGVGRYPRAPSGLPSYDESLAEAKGRLAASRARGISLAIPLGAADEPGMPEEGEPLAASPQSRGISRGTVRAEKPEPQAPVAMPTQPASTQEPASERTGSTPDIVSPDMTVDVKPAAQQVQSDRLGAVFSEPEPEEDAPAGPPPGLRKYRADDDGVVYTEDGTQVYGPGGTPARTVQRKGRATLLQKKAITFNPVFVGPDGVFRTLSGVAPSSTELAVNHGVSSPEAAQMAGMAEAEQRKRQRSAARWERGGIIANTDYGLKHLHLSQRLGRFDQSVFGIDMPRQWDDAAKDITDLEKFEPYLGRQSGFYGLMESSARTAGPMIENAVLAVAVRAILASATGSTVAALKGGMLTTFVYWQMAESGAIMIDILKTKPAVEMTEAERVRAFVVSQVGGAASAAVEMYVQRILPFKEVGFDSGGVIGRAVARKIVARLTSNRAVIEASRIGVTATMRTVIEILEEGMQGDIREGAKDVIFKTAPDPERYWEIFKRETAGSWKEITLLTMVFGTSAGGVDVARSIQQQVQESGKPVTVDQAVRILRTALGKAAGVTRIGPPDRGPVQSYPVETGNMRAAPVMDATEAKATREQGVVVAELRDTETQESAGFVDVREGDAVAVTDVATGETATGTAATAMPISSRQEDPYVASSVRLQDESGNIRVVQLTDADGNMLAFISGVERVEESAMPRPTADEERAFLDDLQSRARSAGYTAGPDVETILASDVLPDAAVGDLAIRLGVDRNQVPQLLRDKDASKSLGDGLRKAMIRQGVPADEAMVNARDTTLVEAFVKELASGDLDTLYTIGTDIMTPPRPEEKESIIPPATAEETLLKPTEAAVPRRGIAPGVPVQRPVLVTEQEGVQREELRRREEKRATRRAREATEGRTEGSLEARSTAVAEKIGWLLPEHDVRATAEGIEITTPDGTTVIGKPSEARPVEGRAGWESIARFDAGMDWTHPVDGKPLHVPEDDAAWDALSHEEQQRVLSAYDAAGSGVVGSGVYEIGPDDWADPQTHVHEADHLLFGMLSEAEKAAVIAKYGDEESALTSEAFVYDRLGKDPADQALQRVRDGSVAPAAAEAAPPVTDDMQRQREYAARRREQLVRTPQFKQWFGDWQAEPEASSKVVDDSGEPLLVYHGTVADIEVFRHGDSIMIDRTLGPHFAEDPAVADVFAGGERRFASDFAIDSYNTDRSWFRDRTTGELRYDGIPMMHNSETGEVEVYDPKIHGGDFSRPDAYKFPWRRTMLPPGGSVYPVYLDIRNPVIAKQQTKGEWDELAISRAVADVVYRQDPELFIEQAIKHRRATREQAQAAWDAITTKGGFKGKLGVDEYRYKATFRDIEKNVHLLTGVDRNRMVDAITGAGYDGLRYENTAGAEIKQAKNPTTWIALRPEQVKSGTGNIGTFRKSDKRIQYAAARRVEAPAPDPTPPAVAPEPTAPAVEALLTPEAPRAPNVAPMLAPEADTRAFAAARRKGAMAEPPEIPEKAEPPPLWRSKMYDVLQQKLPGTVTGPQLVSLLESWAKKGEYKQEELADSKMAEWAREQPGKLSKADVLSELDQRQVEITETVLQSPQYPNSEEGQENALGGTRFDSYSLPGGKDYQELLMQLPSPALETAGAGFEVVRDRGNPGQWAVRNPKGAVIEWNLDRDAAEARLTTYAQAMREDVYRGGHWDQPNVLLHVRHDARTGPNGELVRVVQELQSDWHQEGRKKGYGIGQMVLKAGFRIERVEDIPMYRAAELNFASMRDWAIVDSGGHPVFTKTYSQDLGMDQVMEQFLTDARRLGMESVEPKDTVPDAPLKKSWPEFAMKRMLRWAVDNGYDALAWTTGEQQADRYDLSKQIDAVGYSRRGDLFNVAVWKGAQTILMNQSADMTWVEEHLGKEIAEKMMRGEGRKEDAFKYLEGLDLRVGGEGMKRFYDGILPAFMNKYVKKWGGKVGTETIQTGEQNEYALKWKTGPYAGELVDSAEGVEGVAEKKRFRSIAQATAWAREAAIADQVEIVKPPVTEEVHAVTITPKMRDALQREPQYQYAAARRRQPGQRQREEAARRKVRLEEAVTSIEDLMGKPTGEPEPTAEPTVEPEPEPEASAPGARITQRDARRQANAIRRLIAEARRIGALEAEAVAAEERALARLISTEERQEAVQAEREKISEVRAKMNAKLSDERTLRELEVSEQKRLKAQALSHLRAHQGDIDARRHRIRKYAEEYLPFGPRSRVIPLIDRRSITDAVLDKAVEAIDAYEAELKLKAQRKRLTRTIRMVLRRMRIRRGRGVVRPEYAATLHDIIDAIDEKPPSRKTAARIAASKQFFAENEAAMQDMPERLRARIERSLKQPISEMDIDDLQETEAAILAVLKLNDLKQRDIGVGRWRSIDSVSQAAIDRLPIHAPQKSTLIARMPKEQGAPPERTFLGKIVVGWYDDIDLMARIMDAQENGPLQQVLVCQLQTAENNRLLAVVSAKEWFRARLRSRNVDLGEGFYTWSDVLPDDATRETIDVPSVRNESGILVSPAMTLRLTPAQKISLVLSGRDPDARRSLTGSTGNQLLHTRPDKWWQRGGQTRLDIGRLSDAALEAVDTSLTPQERAFADTMFEFFNVYSKDVVNSTSVDLDGYAIATEENYFPKVTVPEWIKRSRTASALPGKSYAEQTLEDRGPLKARKPGAKAPIVVRDVFEVLEEHIAFIAGYSSYAMPLRQIKSVIGWIGKDEAGNTISMRDQIRKHYGDDWLQELTTMIARVETTSYDTGPLESALAWLRHRTVGAILLGRPTVWVKQATSYPLAALELGYENMAKGMIPSTQDAAHKETFDDIISRSPETENRVLHGRVSRDIGDYLGRHFLLDLLADAKPITEKLAFGVRAGDIVAIRRIAWAAYMRARQDAAPGTSESAIRDSAAEWLERAIRRTQPAWHLKDLSYLGGDPSSVKRWFYMFRTFRDKVIKAQRLRYLRYLESDRSPAAKLSFVRDLAFIAMVAAVLSAIVSEVWFLIKFRRYLRREKKPAGEMATDLAWRALENYLGNWFLLGDAANLIIRRKRGKGWMNDDVLQSPVLETINMLLVELPSDLLTIIAAPFTGSEKDFERAAVRVLKALPEASGRATGLPIEGVFDIIETVLGTGGPARRGQAIREERAGKGVGGPREERVE